jgi:hypothetical protein
MTLFSVLSTGRLFWLSFAQVVKGLGNSGCSVPDKPRCRKSDRRLEASGSSFRNTDYLSKWIECINAAALLVGDSCAIFHANSVVSISGLSVSWSDAKQPYSAQVQWH